MVPANALYFGTGVNVAPAGNAGGGNQNGTSTCATDMVAVGVGFTVNGNSPGFGIYCRAIGPDGQLVAQDQSSATNTTAVYGGTNKIFCPAGKVVTGISFIVWSNVRIRCATPPSLSDGAQTAWALAATGTEQFTNCTTGIVAGFYTRTGSWTDAIGAYCLPYTLNTLSYNVNGGSGTAPASQTQTVPGQLLVTASTYAGTRTGFHLDGWNTLANGLGDDYAVGSNIRPVGATTLYAKWTSTISYNGNTNTGGAVPNSTTAVSSAAITNLAPNSGNLVKTGFTFGGWNTAANGSGTTYLASNPNLVTETPYMHFDANDFNDTTNAWTDISGNNRSIPSTAVTNATTGSIRGNPTKVTNSAGSNGSSKSFPAVQGTTADGIVIGNGALTNYTFCHVARYAGATRARIFAGTTGNWLSGFWNNATGVAYHEGWITDTTGTNDTNWKIQCDTGGSNSSLRSNGVLKSSIANNSTGLPANISINLMGSRSAPAEASDWAVAEFIIYDSVLSDAKIKEVEESLNRKYGVALFTSSIHTYNYASTGDVTLYAQWNSTITYDGNGQTSLATTVPAATIATGTDGNTTLAAPTTLLRTNFTFDGWNTAANGSGTSYAAGLTTYASTGSTTLYAQWKAPITFNGNTNSGGTAPATVNAITSTITLPSNSGNLTKTGYAFSGWNTAANGSGTTYAAGATYSVNGTATLYAYWTPDNTGLTPSFNTNTNSPIGVLASTAYVINTAYTNNVNDLVLSQYADKIQIIASVPSGTLAITTTTNLALPIGYQTALNTAAATISFIGNLTDVNAALATLKYTAPATAVSTTITITAAYAGFNGDYRYNPTAPVNYSSLFPALTRTIAVGALVAPGTPTLDSASDSGSSNSDKITNDNTPTINVGGLTVGATVTLTATPASGTPVTCIFTATTTTGSCTFATMLDGTYSIVATQTLGGTTTAGSTALANVQIDTVRPTVVLTSTVASGANDLIALNTAITNYTITVTFSESVSGLLIGEITKDAASTGWSVGTTLSGSGATYTFTTTNSAALVNDPGKLMLRIAEGVATDAAGNTNTATASDFVLNSVARVDFWDCGPSGQYCTGGTGPASLTQASLGASITLPGPNTLYRTGYSFAGWGETQNSSTILTGSYTPTTRIKLFPQWTPNVYVVTYSANGGNGAPTEATESFTFGTSAISLTTKGTLTKTGYTFAGWNTLATGLGTNYLENANYSPTASIILYAKWTANSYTLTYNANGGTTGSTAAITAGTGVTLSTTAGTKTGYTLAGWNTAADGSGTSYAGATSQTFFSDVTLYALWRPVTPGAPSVSAATAGNTTSTVTVTAVAASGTTVGPAASFTVQAYDSTGTTAIAGETCTVLASVSPLSCEITGLTNGTTYKFKATATNTTGSATGAASTVTAIPAPYVVTYALNGGSLTPTTANYTLGTPVVLPLPSKTGYTFTGWNNPSNSSVGVDGSNYSPSASITLTAQWSANTYTITYNGNGSDGGSVPSAGSFTFGNSYSIATKGTMSKFGYTFAGWTTAANGSGTLYANATDSIASSTASYTSASNLNLYAKWIPQVYTITYNANGATGSPSRATDSYTFGTTAITLPDKTGMTYGGYTFGGWSETPTGLAVINPYSPTQTRTMYAVWSGVQYSITYNENGGTVNTAIPDATYTTGATGITLNNGSTLSRNGYTFSGWKNVAGTTVSGSPYAPTDNVTLYAIWTPKTISVTYDKGIATTTTTFPSNTTVAFGANLTLSSAVDASTTVSATNYLFAGWSINGVIYKAGDTYRISSDAAVTITAQWLRLFDVRYNLNGGSFAPGDLATDSECVTAGLCTDGQSITLNLAPTRTGFTFNGWTNQSGTLILAGTQTSLSSSNYIYYASWTATTYAISFAAGIGSNGNATAISDSYGAIVQLAPSTGYSLTGSVFTGWLIGSVTYPAGALYTMGTDTSPVIATAQYSNNTFKIFYNTNGATSGSTPGPTSAVQGANINWDNATGFTRAGYTFDGWSDGTNIRAANYATTMGGANITVIAQWKIEIPATPTISSATGSDGGATIAISAGSGGAPTSYQVIASPGGAACTVFTPATTCSISPLSNGTAYTFSVTATNSTGTSAAVTSPAVTPAGRPDAPTGVNALRGNAQATVSLTPVAGIATGGPAITYYTVTAYDSNNNVVGTPCQTASSATSCVVTGLTNGTAYTFKATANNGLFTSSASTASTPVIPATVPDPPTSLTASVSTAGAATVSFTAPIVNGGSAITGYAVTSSPGSFTCTVLSTATSCDVLGLTNGIAYTFTALATNDVGNSVASSTSASVTPQSAASAPTTVTATVGDGQASVAFSGAAANGSTIANYTVQAYDSNGNAVSGATCTSTTSPCTVTGLANGSTYTFKVVTNSTVYGSGSTSASAPSVPSNAITPATVPSAPTGLTVTSGTGKVTVGWTAPSANGSPITSYSVQAYDSNGNPVSGATCTAIAPATTCDVSANLVAGSYYTFKVVAINLAGSSSPSNASTSAAINAAPSAPRNVVAVPANASAAVTWDAPLDLRGSALTGYTVTAYTAGNQIAGTCSSTPPTQGCTVSGLTNGTPYTFKVVATNAIGNSVDSVASNPATPSTIPGAPTVVAVAAGDASASISFTAPASNGGSAILYYTVTDGAGHSCSYTVPLSGASANTCTVTGLANGISYTFSVSATNSLGASPAGTSAPAIPATVPTVPQTLSAVAASGVVTLSWTAPLSNGGSAVTSYVVTGSPGGSCTSSTLSCTISGLSIGTPYVFSVIATNSIGNSPASSNTTALTLTQVPSSPTNVGASAANASVVVTWSAPSNNGGSPITGYTATAAPGGATCTATALATTCTVTGLTNETAYTFSVVATTAAGNSASSTSSSPSTPLTTPGSPTGLSATTANQTITLYWSAPSNNGGSPITGYSVTGTNGASCVSSGATSCTMTGLANGTSYNFYVIATNAAGSSTNSVALNGIVPLTVPSAPTSVVVSPANGSVQVSWTASTSTGGSPITGYVVTGNPGGSCTTTGVTSCLITNVTAGTSYTFSVVATNAAGASPASLASSASVIPSSPSAPLSATAVAGLLQATISWQPGTNTGGLSITGYNVTDGHGRNCTTTGATSCVVVALIAGTSYTFSVTAQNSVGTSPSATTNAVIPFTAPSAPSALTAVAGSSSAKVSWSAPSSTGGSAITRYSVTSAPGALTCSATPPATSCVVSGLTPGTSYTFSVVATNIGGSSAPSASSSTVSPFTVPVTPTISATPVVDGTSITVTWNAPGYNGGSAVIGYTLDIFDSTNNPVTTSQATAIPSTCPLTGSSTSCRVDGLTAGHTYYFEVVAINAAGSSALSNSSDNVVTWTVPTSPQQVTATAASSGLLVSWSAPSNDGKGNADGSGILGYIATASNGATCSPATISATSSCEISGLTPGTTYTVSVVAINAMGSSSPASAATSVTPFTVPSAPIIGVATPLNGSAEVTWSAPTSNGGSAIISYTAYDTVGTDSCTVAYPATSCIITGLTPGTGYDFYVVARNAAGVSPDSELTPDPVPFTYPDSPTSVLASQATASSTISWVAPVNDGYSPITGYTVTDGAGDGCSAIGTATSCTVTGLTNGQTYVFTVVAINEAGPSSPPVAAPAVTPIAGPGVPTNVTATSGDGSGTVSWSAPNGVVVSSYTVTANPGGATCTTGVTSCTIGGLTNGTAYTFSVIATNAIGSSNASTSSSAVTPVGVASAPSSARATGNDSQATITWAAPSNTAGDTVTSYTVTDASGDSCTTTTTSCTITGLSNGQSYQFVVAASFTSGATTQSGLSNSVIPQFSTSPVLVNGTAAPAISSGSGQIISADGTATSTALTQPTSSTVEVGNGVTALTLNLDATNVSFSAGTITAVAGATTIASGHGFRNNSTVVLFIFPTATLLGTASVNGSGAFSTSAQLPAGLTGNYTIQVQGFDVSGSLLALDIGITINAPPTPPTPPAPTPPVTRVTTVKPGTPQNVVATQVSGIVTVSWTASGASAQYFTVSSVIDGNVCIVSGATACTLANPLTKGQKRSYAVVATNTAGDSDPGYSNEISVPLDEVASPTTTTTIPPVPPVVVPKITLTCFFAFNSSALSARAKADITAYAKQIIARHITSLTLAGYTDFIGGKAYNQKLSTARAKAVGVYLLLQLRSMSHTGISVRMIGKGISRTSPERAQDRKVTVIS